MVWFKAKKSSKESQKIPEEDAANGGAGAFQDKGTTDSKKVKKKRMFSKVKKSNDLSQLESHEDENKAMENIEADPPEPLVVTSLPPRPPDQGIGGDASNENYNQGDDWPTDSSKPHKDDDTDALKMEPSEYSGLAVHIENVPPMELWTEEKSIQSCKLTGANEDIIMENNPHCDSTVLASARAQTSPNQHGVDEGEYNDSGKDDFHFIDTAVLLPACEHYSFWRFIHDKRKILTDY